MIRLPSPLFFVQFLGLENSKDAEKGRSVWECGYAHGS